LSVRLPPLPDRSLLADLCREAAPMERVQPQLIEKDFYLTRLLWALGQCFGDALLLKGGSLLSKVDLGFFRLSEDADLVLPGAPSRRSSQNVGRMRRVRDAIAEVAGAVGVSARFPAGELHHQAAHGVWQLDYASEFGPQGIMLEVSIRPVIRPVREVRLRQLLADPLAGDLGDARCFALDALEAHAHRAVLRAAEKGRESAPRGGGWHGSRPAGRPARLRSTSTPCSPGLTGCGGGAEVGDPIRSVDHRTPISP
jgi:hypothetical protein